MNEIYALFRRCLPYCIRSEAAVRALLEDPDCRTIVHRSEDGCLVGAAVVHKSTLLLLCVDEAYRRCGIGSALLSKAEQTIRENGYEVMSVGAGDGYIMPGVPSDRPIVPETGMSICNSGAASDPVHFFTKRGFKHSWDCNCFDMLAELDNCPSDDAVPVKGVTFRRAESADLVSIIDCAMDAAPAFARYYQNPELYAPDSNACVMIAVADSIVIGAVILGTDVDGTGSLGCTVVRSDFQGRKIATNLVIHATACLKSSGMRRSFVGYTYSGLDRLYGRAGYHISTYYLMAAKKL